MDTIHEPLNLGLSLKKNRIKRVSILFKTCKINNLSSSRKKHLGAAISSVKHKDEYMNGKIENWITEIRPLSQTAKSEPQASYSCFVSGYKHKLTFYMRTVPEISYLSQRLNHVVSTEFILSITGGVAPSSLKRKLLSLPTKLRVLGMPILLELSGSEYKNSHLLTDHLRSRITSQKRRYENNSKLKSIKNKIT